MMDTFDIDDEAAAEESDSEAEHESDQEEVEGLLSGQEIRDNGRDGHVDIETLKANAEFGGVPLLTGSATMRAGLDVKRHLLY